MAPTGRRQVNFSWDDFITEGTLAYFKPRLDRAPEDAEFALACVREQVRMLERRDAVLAVLHVNCDILRAMPDALRIAYVEPRMIPPGAFVPDMA